MTFANG